MWEFTIAHINVNAGIGTVATQLPFLGIYFSNFRYSIISVYNVFPNKLRFSGKTPWLNVKQTILKKGIKKILTGFEYNEFFIVTLII